MQGKIKTELQLIGEMTDSSVVSIEDKREVLRTLVTLREGLELCSLTKADRRGEF